MSILLLCPYLATTYNSLSLLEILVSLLMKHSPWMCILKTCVVFFSVSYADSAKSSPSSPLMRPTNSFILTRLDYCNSLLAGLPDNKLNKLQRIQNHAARIVLRKPRHVSATSLLRALHWLPVKARIQYKIACLCFQCLSHNTMPPYLSDLLHPYQPSRTLRSLETFLLSVPRFCLETFGRRSLFLAPISGIPYLYLSEKLNVFQLSKRN